MYPTATRYPGPANAQIFRSHDAFGENVTVRWASGNDGIAAVRRHAGLGAVSRSTSRFVMLSAID
jgi:hypothetical protein